MMVQLIVECNTILYSHHIIYLRDGWLFFITMTCSALTVPHHTPGDPISNRGEPFKNRGKPFKNKGELFVFKMDDIVAIHKDIAFSNTKTTTQRIPF